VIGSGRRAGEEKPGGPPLGGNPSPRARRKPGGVDVVSDYVGGVLLSPVLDALAVEPRVVGRDEVNPLKNLEGLPRGPGPPWNDDVGAYPSCERAPAHSFDEIAAAGGAVGQLVPPSSAEISDPRYFRLPRARGERPHGCRATEEYDELPPPHGAYPKAKDRELTIAGLERVGGVRRNKEWRPISGLGS